MNIAQRSPWDEYWNQGGFLKAPRGQMAGGFRLPGAAPQGQTVMDHELAIGDKMAEFKRRPTPPRPEQFDMAAALNAMGGPPQRAALPQRPGPDRSTGSVLGQALAGASDVFGAAAGQRTGNLDRMQALQRQQADTQYQDQLRQAAVAHENQNQGWNFQLQKLGAQQAASDRTQQNYGQDVGIQMSEDNALAGDLQRRMDNIRRGQMDTKADNYASEDLGFRKRAEERGIAERAGRQPAMDFALDAARAKEGREKEIHDIQVPALRRQLGGGADIQKYSELVGATLGITPNKEAAASDLISKIDPNDPNAAAKMQMVREALRRSLPPDTTNQGGTGFWGGVGEAQLHVPFMNIPGQLAYLLATDDPWNSPEQANQQGIWKQMQRIKQLRAQGIPMEGFGPSK